MDRAGYCQDGKGINVPFIVVGSIPVSIMPLVRANVPLNSVVIVMRVFF